MSEKTIQRRENVEQLKAKLSKVIRRHIDDKKSESSGEAYNYIHFARDIDEAMGLSTKWYERQDQDECNKRTKNVSRWACGEVFPSMEVLIGISKVLKCSINELFEDVYSVESKTKKLSDSSKKVLKMLLSEQSAKQGENVSLYFPYAFNGEELKGCGKLFTRQEVVEIYKTLAVKKHQITRMKDFFQVLGKKEPAIQEKYFPRFCSCYALESEDDEVQRISFDNTNECYERLQKVWEKVNCKDIFNVIYFEEAEFCFDNEGFKEFGLSEMGKDKAVFYQHQAEMNQVYESAFRELLDKKIIIPQEEKDCGVEFENKQKMLIKEKNDKKFCYFRDVNGLSVGEYQLETVKFKFLINLTKQEIKRFYQEELEKEFAED